jgi:rSAM/selenodomain-associated transferase 1
LRTALVLFGKSPDRGKVKTRLAESVGEEGAASLSAAFLKDAAERYAHLPGVEPVLAADPEPETPFFQATFGPPWRRESQGAGDLGARLTRAFRRELAAFDRVAAVGADHPALPSAELDRFLSEGAAVWPAADGGYAAIVLSRPRRADGLFEGIDWSTERVLRQTLDQARRHAIELTVYPTTRDVDREEDLEPLAQLLASLDPRSRDFPRHTSAVLASILAVRTVR